MADTPSAFEVTIADIRAFVDVQVQVMTGHGRFKQFHGWWNISHFIIETGQEFRPEPLPTDIEYRVVQHCFENATNLMRTDPERFVYCEGLGVTSWFPMNHAWVWDRQRKCVADPTWRFGEGHDPAGYIGIPFTSEYVENALMESETYGLIDDWLGHWPLLKRDPSEFRAKL